MPSAGWPQGCAIKEATQRSYPWNLLVQCRRWRKRQEVWVSGKFAHLLVPALVQHTVGRKNNYSEKEWMFSHKYSIHQNHPEGLCISYFMLWSNNRKTQVLQRIRRCYLTQFLWLVIQEHISWVTWLISQEVTIKLFRLGPASLLPRQFTYLYNGCCQRPQFPTTGPVHRATWVLEGPHSLVLLSLEPGLWESKQGGGSHSTF